MSSADSLLAGSLSEQRKALDHGDINASELVDTSLARIADGSSLGVVIGLRESAARAEAEAADRRIADGKPLSPLDGIPILLKDNIVQAGEPATCASRILEGYVSVYRFPTAKRWRRVHWPEIVAALRESREDPGEQVARES